MPPSAQKAHAEAALNNIVMGDSSVEAAALAAAAQEEDPETKQMLLRLGGVASGNPEPNKKGPMTHSVKRPLEERVTKNVDYANLTAWKGLKVRQRCKSDTQVWLRVGVVAEEQR